MPIKHGDCPRTGSTSLYHRWEALVARTTKDYLKASKDYKGRGITVFSDWVGSAGYIKFKQYIVSAIPDYEELIARGYQIDRIDNNGNYEPGNIRFIPKVKNMRNRRVTKKVMWRGELMAIGDIIEMENCPFSYSVVHDRIRLGWTVSEAINTPYAPGRRQYKRCG